MRHTQKSIRTACQPLTKHDGPAFVAIAGYRIAPSGAFRPVSLGNVKIDVSCDGVVILSGWFNVVLADVVKLTNGSCP